MLLMSDFFNRDARVVAKEILGTYLVREIDGNKQAYKIIETEAYIGPHDKASHAHKGRTARTEIMFGEPGRWYVYLVYGMHYMLNIVTGKKEYPAAVLIRGVVSSDGSEISGPGRVTKALGVRKAQNGIKAIRQTGLWIEDRGEKVSARDILKTPRIGIPYAQEWKDKPYRYVLKN